MNNLHTYEREDLTPIRKLLMMKALAGGEALKEYTETGNPVTFETNVAKPMSVVASFTPVQSGSGDPSPDNVRPITGFTGANVYLSPTDADDPEKQTFSVAFPAEAGTVYGGTLDLSTGVLTVEYVTVDLGSLSWTVNNGRFYTNGLSNVIKRGAFARRLEMYCPIFLCISDGRQQALVPDMSIYEGGNGNVFIHDSDYTDKDTFKEAMDGIALCYPLIEPQTVTLTPTQITAIIGNNVVWSDLNGDLTVTYKKKG